MVEIENWMNAASVRFINTFVGFCIWIEEIIWRCDFFFIFEIKRVLVVENDCIYLIKQQ